MSEEIVELLKASGFSLGGSRRMNELYPASIIIGEATDWDFYFDGSLSNAAKILLDAGFRKLTLSNTDYCDNQLVSIYKHDSHPIEVLERKDSKLYKQAFESISETEFLYRIWKSTPHVNCTDFPAFKHSVKTFMNERFNKLDLDLPF